VKARFALLALVAFTFCANPANLRADLPSLKQTYANDFLIGVALGGILPTDINHRELNLIQSQFNAITPEYCMKASFIHPQENTWDFRQSDSLVNFAQANQMKIFGHTLVWHEDAPDWFFQDNGQPATRQKVLDRLKTHIQTEVTRYKGKIQGWDVVNEALADNGPDLLRKSPWRTAIGDDYVLQAYRFAHEADPNADLQYNDYDIESPPKRDKAIKLIQMLKANGIPIAAVGIQGHWQLDQIPFDDLDQSIDIYHAMGLKVMISELDLDVLPRRRHSDPAHPTTVPITQPTTRPLPELLETQANQYAKLFALFHKHRDAITRITFWGLDDQRSWLNYFRKNPRTDYPLLFDRRSLPKPAFYAVINVMNRSATQP
jgi:endo-1,4-beta-xylanase